MDGPRDRHKGLLAAILDHWATGKDPLMPVATEASDLLADPVADDDISLAWDHIRVIAPSR